MTKTITIPVAFTIPAQPVNVPGIGLVMEPGAQPTTTNGTATLTLDDNAQAIFSPAPAGQLLTPAQLVSAGYTASTLLQALTIIETGNQG